MNLRNRFPLMNAVDTTASTAAPAAPAPAPAADAPAATPAPAPSPDTESLLKPSGEATETNGESTAVDYAWLPDKFRVNGADGKLDLTASSQKLGESYRNLERGRSLAPASAKDYTFTPPEDMKGLVLDDALSDAFREGAHKVGMSQEQYDFVMGQYMAALPQLLNTSLEMSATDARTELSKVWQSPAVYEAQVNNAIAAIEAAPADIRDDLHARFGRDPAFIRFAASLGQGMREDRAPAAPDRGAGGPETMDSLMASEAYRNPKHADHKAVSERVMKLAQRATGGA